MRNRSYSEVAPISTVRIGGTIIDKGWRTVLVVAHPFPPIGGGEVQRVTKFAKYLPEFGWHPVVITLARIFSNSYFYDESLLSEITERVIPIYRINYRGPSMVYRFLRDWGRRKRVSGSVKSLNQQNSNRAVSGNSKIERFLRSFYIPSPFVESVPALVKCGKEIVAKHGVDAIFSTSPASICHLVALRLKRYTGLPWVADFRDPWTQNPFASYPTFLHKWGNELLEQRVLWNADRVIARSQGQMEKLIEKYPFIRGKGDIIPNGFDPADFCNIVPVNHDRFTIVHTGRLYGLRRPESFLAALSLLRSQDPSVLEGIQVLFVGMADEDLSKRINSFDLDGKVKLMGPVMHKQSLAFQKGADVLLLFSGEDSGTIAAKVYEYLASRKMILAVAPPRSEVADLVEGTASGTVISPDDVSGIASTLRNLYYRWLSKNLAISPDQDRIAVFDRKLQTKNLSAILSVLCNGRAVSASKV